MESPLALLCQQVLRRHALTSHGGAWESRGSPRRWTSNRTRCTCCRQGRAGELDPGHTRIRARSSSNRNVCILSPCQFSFRRVVYQTDSPRAMPPPIPVPNWILATLELATLPRASCKTRCGKGALALAARPRRPCHIVHAWFCNCLYTLRPLRSLRQKN